jgi:hypothetical protein
MNANELADKLLGSLTMEYDCDKYMEQAAAMLRQQADRIGVLEANHKIQLNINEKALQYIEQLEQGLRASIDLNNAQAKRAQEK